MRCFTLHLAVFAAFNKCLKGAATGSRCLGYDELTSAMKGIYNIQIVHGVVLAIESCLSSKALIDNC